MLTLLGNRTVHLILVRLNECVPWSAGYWQEGAAQGGPAMLKFEDAAEKG
jgi:hypothetical protein